MSSIINGNNIKISVFGQSHSDAIGCVIDGLPAGIILDTEYIASFMKRRAPGNNNVSTQRKEADFPEIVSGLSDGVTCGAPLCAVIKNTGFQSKDYSELKVKPRPSHADLGYSIKTNSNNDIKGGGHSSGRLTAPLCFAGAIALQLLKERGITVKAHIFSVADVYDTPFDPMAMCREDIASKPFPVVDDAKGDEMQRVILAARDELDSVGGVIECMVSGMPRGVGDPMFDGVENLLSRNIFGIPAVKGIEFGAGFELAKMRGSQANDPFEVKDGAVVTTSNNNGGILGGMTTGMPVLFRVVIKPTPSIARQQNTVDLSTMQNTTLCITGRHDPCIVQRAVPVVEAVAAITMLDLIL